MWHGYRFWNTLFTSRWAYMQSCPWEAEKSNGCSLLASEHEFNINWAMLTTGVVPLAAPALASFAVAVGLQQGHGHYWYRAVLLRCIWALQADGQGLVCYSVWPPVPTGRHCCPGDWKGCEAIQLLCRSHPELGPFLYVACQNITRRNSPAAFEEASSFHPSSLFPKRDSRYLDIPYTTDPALSKALGTDVIFIPTAVPVLQHSGNRANCC